MNRANKIANANPLIDHLRFYGRLLVSPRSVGAIAPSGPALTRAIASQIDLSSPGAVLELGPGSGTITKAILEHGVAPDRLILLERDPSFVRLLTSRYPAVSIVQGDAFNFDRAVGDKISEPLAAIVSGLPLLNFPSSKRRALLDLAFSKLAPGAPFIQFSYGFKSPVDFHQNIDAKRTAFVMNNIPPAQVWVYKKK